MKIFHNVFLEQLVYSDLYLMLFRYSLCFILFSFSMFVGLHLDLSIELEYNSSFFDLLFGAGKISKKDFAKSTTFFSFVFNFSWFFSSWFEYCKRHVHEERLKIVETIDLYRIENNLTHNIQTK